MAYPYPSEFPLDSINDLIAIVPTGDLLNEKAVNAYWTILGYGLNVVKPLGPSPAPKPTFAATSGEVTNEEFVEALHAAKGDISEEGVCQTRAVPWGRIISFILKVLPLFLAEEQG